MFPQTPADVVFVLQHVRNIQPLLLFLLFLTVIFLALSNKSVLERTPWQIVQANKRVIKTYLCILIVAQTLILFFWYLDIFVVNIPFPLFPFALILLIIALSFDLRLTFIALVAIGITVNYYLVEPRYHFLSGNMANVVLQCVSILSLGISVIIGRLLRRYQKDLGVRVDELREINWQTRERLAAKTQEEAILRSIYKGSLVVGSSQLAQQTVSKNIIKETQRLVKTACTGIILRNTANEISCEHSKDRFTRNKEQELIAFIREVVDLEKMQMKRVAIIPIPKSIALKHQKRVGRQFGNMLIAPLSIADGFGMIFLLRMHKEEVFSENDVHTMTLFAAPASLAIRNAQHHEDLEYLMRARDQFASAIAHELNTPLATIKLYAQLQQQKLKDIPQTTDIKKTLAIIDQEVNRLSSLIHSLVDFAHMQSGKVKLDKKQFSLRKSCKDRLEVLKHLHPEHKFTFTCTVRQTPIVADQIRLEQVVTNLLNNAVKYAPPQKPIELKITKKRDEYVVSIKDYGVGVNKNDAAKIFEPFYQAKQSVGGKGSEKGLGLGLYISLSIVELHGGKIWVESEVGKGSTFFFSLPATI